MFKTMLKSVVVLAVAAQLGACSTETALINYDKMDSDVKVSAEPMKGKSLGAVKGDKGGAIWDKCDEKATASVREMMEKAKALGGNAVGDVVWRATANKTPSCKKGWGYLVIWPFILTPLFMSTAVDGVAYNTSGGATKKGMYLIPSSESEQLALAKRIVQEM